MLARCIFFLSFLLYVYGAFSMGRFVWRYARSAPVATKASSIRATLLLSLGWPFILLYLLAREVIDF